MQDLPTALRLEIAAASPAVLLVLFTVVGPLIGRIVPRDLRRAFREPSDGTTAPPGSKDYADGDDIDDDGEHDGARTGSIATRSWKTWVLSVLAGVQAVAWTVAALLVLIRDFAWSTVIEVAVIAACWVSLDGEPCSIRILS